MDWGRANKQFEYADLTLDSDGTHVLDIFPEFSDCVKKKINYMSSDYVKYDCGMFEYCALVLDSDYAHEIYSTNNNIIIVLNNYIELPYGLTTGKSRFGGQIEELLISNLCFDIKTLETFVCSKLFWTYETTYLILPESVTIDSFDVYEFVKNHVKSYLNKKLKNAVEPYKNIIELYLAMLDKTFIKEKNIDNTKIIKYDLENGIIHTIDERERCIYISSGG
jgi:hypothetical protein